MAIYSAYLPPRENMENPAETFRLVSDAKAPLALIFPPFWLAWHRLWLPLMAYAVIMIAIGILAAAYPSTPVFYLSALPGLYLLLEGNSLIAGKLERQGWRFAGVVDAENREDAELRFLVQNEQALVASEPKKPVIPSPKTAPLATAPLGLFPE